jgi:hypothetical protein
MAEVNSSAAFQAAAQSLLQHLLGESSRFTSDTPKPYLERQVEKPKFIWKDGQADLDAVAQTLVDQQLPRLEQLRSPVIEKRQPPVEPIEYPALTENTDLQAAELPLISDVWNSNEPVNYVSMPND